MSLMIDHLSIAATDLKRSVEFYRRTLAPLDASLQHVNENEASFGPGTDRTFWLYPSPTAAPMAGMHIAFAASTRAAVDEAHANACAAGGQSARTPGERPDLSPDYYGAVVLDPDGHRLEILVSAPRG